MSADPSVVPAFRASNPWSRLNRSASLQLLCALLLSLAVSLAGWYLSDDGDDLDQWAIPATNTLAAWGSQIKFNFAKEDAADDLLLNEVIWRSVKGSNQPMPAPVRAGFVMVKAGRDED